MIFIKMQKGNHYLNSISTELAEQELFDIFLYESNGILYNYGDHQKGNVHSRFNLLKSLATRWILKIKSVVSGTLKKEPTDLIISNAYVTVPLGTRIVAPPWSASFRNNVYPGNVYKTINAINKVRNARSLRAIYSKEFYNLIKAYKRCIEEFVKKNKLKAAFFPNDLSFYENLTIHTLNGIGIPTFVYLHGLPARYNRIDDNRAKYLVVWGEGIKKNYVDAGVDPDKILTLKHPVYHSFQFTSLRSSLDNILVLTKAINGTPSSSDFLNLPNRSVSLTYLEKVKSMLGKVGVKKANLRLHPSENADFYRKNLIDDFFTISEDSKEDCLKNASLVVGPTSTMVLDAILANVNYILFDPVENDLTLEGLKLVSPFDGKSFIKLTVTEADFVANFTHPLENINKDLLNDYFETTSEDQVLINLVGA